MPGADGWQVSNVNILGTAAHLPALDLFRKAGMKKLREKSVQLTGFLEFLLLEADPESRHFQILTPSDPEQRGCQLSLFFPRHGLEIFNYLSAQGIVTDWRENNLSDTEDRSGVIRIAPTPMYNSYTDVYVFVHQLKAAIREAG